MHGVGPARIAPGTQLQAATGSEMVLGYRFRQLRVRYSMTGIHTHKIVSLKKQTNPEQIFSCDCEDEVQARGSA